MEAHRPEVHSFLLRPFLDDAARQLGAERLSGLVAGLGSDLDVLQQSDSWVSLDLLGTLLERLEAETGDPNMLARCGRVSLSSRYLGVLRPLFRAFGTPDFAFSQVESSTARFNKVGRYMLLERQAGQVRIAYEPLPGAPRERGIVCRGRSANLAAIPTMFDLPAAEVLELECIHRGDAQCVYELRWKRRPTRLLARLAALAGLAAGCGTGAALASSVPSAVAAGVMAGTSLWAFARVVELRRELSERAADVLDQQDALRRSVRANERRYAELLEAKEAVEERVQLRTRELRETSDELAETLRQLRDVSRVKDDFFANVSHELRTPLTLILAPLDDLAAGRTPPGGRDEAFQVMHRNASRLLVLVNQLLDLSKIDAGAMKAERTPTDPRRLVEGVITGFRSAADERGIRVELGAPAAMPALMLDAAWIESAVTNLVANAMRYAASTVAVRLTDSEGSLRIEVEDDGPGMAPDEVERVFDRFAQGATSERRGGTGLGLAIVREAARLHGGDAAARSVDGRGTTFTVSLPRVLAVGPEHPEQASSAPPAPPSGRLPPAGVLVRAPSRAGETREGPSADAPLALVVEDNDDLCAYIADVLSRDYRVRTASDGRSGLDLALALRPQVVVSDVSMPGMDGLDLVRALRARDETRTTPVILVTARQSAANVLEGFEAGADDYVPKPFHGRELLARVDVHVRLRALVREMAHRERLATLGVVAASVAHQVRNPLTVLMSGLPSVQRRLKDQVDAPTREMLDVMVGCARRIERMTVDLLDLSRVDREEQGSFRPGEALASAVRLVSAGLPSTVELSAEIDETTALRGRPGDVNHVFLNLIDNAARAVDDAGTLRVRGAVEDGWYVVTVEDSGPGIPEEQRARVFDPFFTTRAAGEGTGLGLSIAQQVIAQHGGRIEVGGSNLGGACFTVRIPKDGATDRVVSYDVPSLPATDRG